MKVTSKQACSPDIHIPTIIYHIPLGIEGVAVVKWVGRGSFK